MAVEGQFEEGEVGPDPADVHGRTDGAIPGSGRLSAESDPVVPFGFELFMIYRGSHSMPKQRLAIRGTTI